MGDVRPVRGYEVTECQPYRFNFFKRLFTVACYKIIASALKKHGVGNCNKLLKKDLKAPRSRSAMDVLFLGKCSPYDPIQAMQCSGNPLKLA